MAALSASAFCFMCGRRHIVLSFHVLYLTAFPESIDKFAAEFDLAASVPRRAVLERVDRECYQ